MVLSRFYATYFQFEILFTQCKKKLQCCSITAVCKKTTLQYEGNQSTFKYSFKCEASYWIVRFFFTSENDIMYQNLNYEQTAQAAAVVCDFGSFFTLNMDFS